MVSEPMLSRYVKDALANLYDPVHLQTHPLADVLLLPLREGECIGECLRRILWEVVESLRPPAFVPTDQPEWLNYRLLWLYYLQTVDQDNTCRQLGLSQRSFYRHQRLALDAVASLLRQRYLPRHLASASAPGESGGPAETQMLTEQAVRWAREAPRRLVSLRDSLSNAIATVRPLAVQRGISLTWRISDQLPPIYADPAALHQVFVNALMAGITGSVDATLVLTVDVRDNTCLWQLRGLDSATRPPDALETMAALRLADALLSIYGGRLRLDHDVRQNAVLCLFIPIIPQRTVLIIDDDADTIGLYRRYLETHGYVVRSAHTSEELDAELAAESPDLVLLDVLMPRQDGWRVLQRLKETPRFSSVPVLICSVISQPQLALSLGATVVLQKPIAESTMLEAVSRCLAPTHNASQLGQV